LTFTFLFRKQKDEDYNSSFAPSNGGKMFKLIK